MIGEIHKICYVHLDLKLDNIILSIYLDSKPHFIAQSINDFFFNFRRFFARFLL